MSDQPTREELLTRIDELESQLTEGVEHAARDRILIRQQVSETKDDIDEDLREEQNTRGREGAKITRRLSEVEDRLDIDASEAFATADGGKDIPHLTPLQRLIRHGPSGAVKHPTVNTCNRPCMAGFKTVEKR